jgi:peptide deformylase
MRHGTIPGSTGTVRPVRLLGDPALHEPCREVTDFDSGLAALIEDLFATMYAADGVGLASSQLGGHVVNPRLVRTDGVTVTGPEGCLSLPRIEAGTTRYDETVVEGFDLRGEPLRIEGTGFFARCLQHECDHLDGLLFTDRVTGRRRRRALRAARRAPWASQ